MTLTLLGIGTAFVILLILGAMMALVGWVARRHEGLTRTETPEAAQEPQAALERDRALAAVVAVGLLMAQREVQGGEGPSE